MAIQVAQCKPAFQEGGLGAMAAMFNIHEMRFFIVMRVNVVCSGVGDLYCLLTTLNNPTGELRGQV